MPEDHQVHWGRTPTTGDSPLGPNGVLGLGETGKGMNLGEVRVDRTSVAYLVHAVRGGGPVGGLTAFGEGERSGAHHVRGRGAGTVRSSPRSGKGNGPELTTFGEGERSGAHHVRGRGTVRSSPRLCLMLGTVGLGFTHPLTDRAQKCARAGRPTPCPLSLAAGRRPPQSGKEKTRGENHKSPRDCPCPRVDSLRRT